MAEIYWFGLCVTWAVLSIAWLMVLGHCVYTYAGAYIQDEKLKAPPNRFIPDARKRWRTLPHDASDTFFLLLISFFLGTVSGLVWPIAWVVIFCAWVVIFCIGSLRGARAFVRFQKSYQTHKHDKETGAVI